MLSESLTFVLPSKTFLLGEYLALQGGPSAILNTQPCFRLTITPNKTFKLLGIHPQSPAGLLLHDHQAQFAESEIVFTDPHDGQGGLGASSAQFAGIYKAIYGNDVAIATLLETYRHYAFHGTGTPPSGADVVSQLQQGICYFDGRDGSVQTRSWPFDKHGFALIRTGKKLATHEHLKTPPKIDAVTLREIVLTGWQALNNSDIAALSSAINAYANALQAANCLAEHSQRLLNSLSGLPGIIASKGCGALGADVLLVLYELKHEDAVTHWCVENNVAMIAKQSDLTA